MSQIIAILNILGSAASIVGLIATFNGVEAPITKEWAQNALWASLALSAYVLFVPRNPLAQNAGAKFKSYSPPSTFDGAIHLQDGEFTLYGRGDQTIRFAIPFVEPPEIEIIDTGGCTGDCFPKVVKTSKFSFTVSRSDGRRYSGTLENYPDKFEWIATGAVLVDRSA